MANRIPSTLQAIHALIEVSQAAGADELILWPTIPDLNQIKLLEEALP